ncbi:C40 family peptidase [Paenibacillus sp. N1-5-1-14]|uniref:C40 family peptidase n=1 Tax=Paenibacillus radicibacter TaxID=2972488 RepID=UPI002158EB65|nr:C40 family peptidase [Paenibacillus radicibacter]MCR8642757.1 C40 family peptidase [Paenibacillus radicibacter]
MNHTHTSKWKKVMVGVSLTVAMLGVSSMTVATPVQAAVTTSNKTASQKADAIIKDAQSLMGKVKYVFGKNDPAKLTFDCSSFTKFLFAKQGVDLKWGSSAQSKQGTSIKQISQLKKGDLVYFSVSTPGQVNHVGVYMGDGKFIHNLSPKDGVVISDLSKGNWTKRFISGSRVL